MLFSKRIPLLRRTVGIGAMVAVGLFGAPALAGEIVLACPKLPAGTDFGTLIFDLESIDIHQSYGDGDMDYEFQPTLAFSVFGYDPQNPNFKGQAICNDHAGWRKDMNIPNIQTGWTTYHIPQRVKIENVPRNSQVDFRFSLREYDPLDSNDVIDVSPQASDMLDFTVYPNDKNGDVPNVEGPRDLVFGQTKVVGGDGRGANVDANATVRFQINVIQYAGTPAPAPAPTPAPVPNPADPNQNPACRNYALRSVEQNHEAQQLGCGFQPPVWSNDHQMHFDWCANGNNVQTVQTHIQARDAELAKCRQSAATPAPAPAPDPGIVGMCQIYANEALKIAAKAAALNCQGITGPRWLQDYTAHYNWCMANPNPIFLLAEAAARDAAYKACGGK